LGLKVGSKGWFTRPGQKVSFKDWVPRLQLPSPDKGLVTFQTRFQANIVFFFSLLIIANILKNHFCQCNSVSESLDVLTDKQLWAGYCPKTLIIVEL
jgi:hypothetical protein